MEFPTEPEVLVRLNEVVRKQPDVVSDVFGTAGRRDLKLDSLRRILSNPAS